MTIVKPKKQIIFSDINIAFTAHPMTGQLNLLYNEDAVKRAVKNLVLTNQYEKLFQPTTYGGVTGSLFELLDDGDLIILKNQINDTIQNYEPRAKVLEVVVDRDRDPNGLDVTIYLEIINQPQPVAVNVFLERIR